MPEAAHPGCLYRRLARANDINHAELPHPPDKALRVAHHELRLGLSYQHTTTMVALLLINIKLVPL